MAKHQKQKIDANNMTMAEHMRELRLRMSAITIVLIMFFITLYLNSKDLLDILLEVGKTTGFNFVYISPQEVMVQQLQLAFVLALLLTLPFVLYEVVAFIAPVFTNSNYKVKALCYCACIILLCLGGMYFAIRVMLPFIYQFLYGVGVDANVQSAVSIREYTNLFLTIVICVGIIFELPFVCMLLVNIGIASTKTLKKFRRCMVIIALLVSALITPPDVISQCMVAIPIILLYQISILLCSILERRKRYE